MLEVWLPILFIVAVGACWYHVFRLREEATAHARSVCQRCGVQLLDDSVALHRLHMSWRHGAVRVLREYRFETSLGGNDRQSASLTLRDGRVVRQRVPQYERSAAAAPPFVSRYPYPQPGSDRDPHPEHNVIPIGRARRTPQ